MSELTWMADAFRAQGLTVREVTGWKHRGRPGTFSPRGVVFHHTASGRKSGSAPSLHTCRDGRPGINGPLCNVMIGRDRTVFVVAAGRANHAGKGGPFRNIPRDSANAFMAGVEVENDGVDEKWTPELLHTCDVVFATLLLGLHRSPSWLIGHKEWAPKRKIDPRTVDMDERRAGVAHRMARQANGHTAAAAAKAGGGHKTAVHVVVKGETLFAIAQANHLTVQQLKVRNKLTSNLIVPGQRLAIGA